MLGDTAAFRRIFMQPISVGRERDASPHEKKLGSERAAQLQRILDLVLLRRDSSVNDAYLPPRQDYIVFCRPSILQDRRVRREPQAAATGVSPGVASVYF